MVIPIVIFNKYLIFSPVTTHAGVTKVGSAECFHAGGSAAVAVTCEGPEADSSGETTSSTAPSVPRSCTGSPSAGGSATAAAASVGCVANSRGASTAQAALMTSEMEAGDPRAPG